MIKRKYFACGGFGHIAYHYRNIREERLISMLLNRFEVLKNKVIQRGEGS